MHEREVKKLPPARELDPHVESLMPVAYASSGPDTRICPSCSSPMPQEYRFCGHCGYPLSDSTARSPVESTTTILFTDMAGFSQLMASVGDEEALDILKRHNQIVRTQIQDHGGFEVKYQGDGFMVAFRTARRAVLCAVDIQKRMVEYNREYPARPLVLRMGLNAGDVLREEGDFFGAAVNLAARIAEKAKGGQILMSELVKGLAGPYPGFEYAPCGSFRLRGFPGRYKLYEVVWRS